MVLSRGVIFIFLRIQNVILYFTLKKRIWIILLALDYTKAFFDFIHETFRVFNFGESFCNWIRVIFNGGGESSITNNGHISGKFEISRSTRQGDPISPQIFI